MAENIVECPLCGLSDKTFKVSAIYIEALEGFKKEGTPKILPQIMGDQSQMDAPGILKVQALRSIINTFGPPSGGRQIMRPINPGLVIAGFTLITIFFLVQIYTSQREMFIPILIVALVFYLGYVIFHKQIMGKYQKQIQDNIDIKRTYEAAIGQWMRLYYCAHDDGVFDPDENQLIPLQAMESYLLKTHIT
jgi:hypothetical protein